MKKVGLVLGGGGARCFAHLGIIEVLQRNNIKIDCIASSSMGSIIAALIGNNVPIYKIKEEFYKRLTRIKWLVPSVSRVGFLSQRNIKNILLKLLSTDKIEESKIPLYIVATNLDEAKLEVFYKGNIIDAVLASSAFPGIYPPVVINNKYFVDGGVLNNIPADICREKIGSDNIVISSKLEGDFYNINKKYNPFKIIWRSVYIPLIKQREKIVKENSDIILDPLRDIVFDFKNWRDILKFYNKRLLEDFYSRGKKEMEEKMPMLNELLNE